eukprot:Hpha_TRINITY_DN25223_c0_g1::TRINITY_DN25223_c0_g1_i1::g.110805::m.110805
MTFAKLGWSPVLGYYCRESKIARGPHYGLNNCKELGFAAFVGELPPPKPDRVFRRVGAGAPSPLPSGNKKLLASAVERVPSDLPPTSNEPALVLGAQPAGSASGGSA